MPTNLGHRLARVLAARNRAEAEARAEEERVRAEIAQATRRFLTRFVPALEHAASDANRGMAGAAVLGVTVTEKEDGTAEAHCAIEDEGNPFPATLDFKLLATGVIAVSSRKTAGAAAVPPFAADIPLADDNAAEIDEALFGFVTEHLGLPDPDAPAPAPPAAPAAEPH